VRVLVAGAAGQLGRSLQAALRGHDVTALDRGRLDIASLESVRAAVKVHAPEIVVNAAAFNEVDRAETDPEPAFRANAVGPGNLALAAAEGNAAMLHVSSDYVFDGASGSPYDERAPTHPLSVYGRSKLAGEGAVRDANPRHYVVRTAWLYHADGRNFPNTMLALAGRPSVRVVSDQVGSPTYAPHLAAAIAKLIATGAYGTYHLAGRGAASWYELTCALYRIAGIETPVEPVATQEFPRPAPRPRYSALTTIQDPRILLPPWEEGLAAFVEARSRDGATSSVPEDPPGGDRGR
jgi:dTDP-4-dehydrorhamnose reductase